MKEFNHQKGLFTDCLISNQRTHERPPLTRGLSAEQADWGREKYPAFSPSVFCFAKSTSLIRGRLFAQM